MDTIYTGYTSVRVDAMFFARSLQYIFDLNVPLFYSFRVQNNQVKLINYTTINNYIIQKINLPILVGDANFILPDNYLNYQIIGYLTGIDLNQSALCWTVGIITKTTLTTQEQIQVWLQFQKKSCDIQSNGLLMSFSLNLFIFNKKNIQKTQYFIQHYDVRFNSSYLYYTSTQPFSKPLNQCQYIIGLTGAYSSSNENVALKFRQVVQIQQNNPNQINFTLNNDSTYMFLIFGRVRCSSGYFYNKDKDQCQSQTNFSFLQNYYITEDFLYSNTQLPCISACLLQPNKTFTCLDLYNQSRQCKPCTSPKLSYLIIDPLNNSNQQCKSCSQLFGNDCLQCTVDQCTKCSNDKEFNYNTCVNVDVKCDDNLWMPERGEQCDNVKNGPNTGCLSPQCKIQEGFFCLSSPYRWADEPSQCYYDKLIEIQFIKLKKLEFSNTLQLTYFLKKTFWDQHKYIQQTTTISSTYFDNITVIKEEYDPQNEQLLVEINYDKCRILNNMVKVENNNHMMNFSVLDFSVLTSETISITYSMLNEAYWLNSHADDQYSYAKILVVFFELASVMGLGFVIAGFIGGKYIVIETLSILQMTYFGLLMIERYTPLYLAVNRLGLAALEVMNNKNPNYEYSQLNTLGLSDSFLSNCNIQLIVFIVCILLGVVFFILQKVVKSTKSMAFSIISDNLFAQYALYGLMLWGYVISLSVGLQIKCQLLSKLNPQQQQVNIPSLVVGCICILVMIGYTVAFSKKSTWFGQFYKEMMKFQISEKLVVLLMFEKLTVGFGLGLGYEFEYIGFALGGVELGVALLVYYVNPFYYDVHSNRSVVTHLYLCFILCLYNLQKLFYTNQQLTQSNSWFYAWPIIIVILIYFFLLKNIIFMIKQIRITLFRLSTLKLIYSEYVKRIEKRKIKEELQKQELQSSQANNNEKINVENNAMNDISQQKPQRKQFLGNLINRSRLKKIQLTEQQLYIWKNFTKVGGNDLFAAKTNVLRETTKNNKHQEKSELMNGNFRTKMAQNINKINKCINKKIKKAQQNSNEQEQNQQQSNNNSIENIDDDKQKSSDRQFLQTINDKNRKKIKSNQDNNINDINVMTQIYLKRSQQKNKPVHQKRLMTAKQYDEKVKGMSFYDHWNQIDENIIKFDLNEPQSTFKPFEFKAVNENESNLMHYFQSEKKQSQQYENKPKKKIFYKGGERFNQLSQNINNRKRK